MRLFFKYSILIPVLFIAGCGKIPLEEQLINAELDYKANNYQAVIIQMKNLIREQPDNNDARLLLANSNYQLGLFLNAEKEYIKAQELGTNINLIANFYIKALYGNNDFIGITDFWTKNIALLSTSQKAEIAPVVSIAYLNQAKFQESFDIATLGKSLAQETNMEKLIIINSAYANTFNNPTDLSQKTEELGAACNEYPTEWVTCDFLANTLFSESQFSAAALVFDKILKNKPNHNQLVFKLADSYIKSENYSSAEPLISSLLKSFPRQPYANLLAATIEMDKKDYEQALIHINKTLSGNYKTPQARLIAGIIHYQLGNIEQANSHLQGLTNIYPNNPVVTKLYIATQLKLGNSANVYSAASQLIPSKNNSELLLSLSSDLLKLGEEEFSTDILKIIDTSLIDNQKILKSISIMKLKSGDQSVIDELERVLTNSIQSNASVEEINDNKLLLISSLITVKDTDKAKKYILSWIQDSPDNIENYQLLAEVEKREKPINIDTLSKIYTLIISKDINNVNANIYFGATALKSKNYILAKKHYSNAFNQNPSNIRAILGLYFSSQNLHIEKEITQIIESGLKGYKDNIQKRLALSQFYLIAKQPEKTINLLESPNLTLGLNKNMVNLVLAEAFLEKKEYKKAITLYKEMLNDNLDNKIAIDKIMYSYEKANDLNGAVKTFKELHVTYPENIQIGLSLASVNIFTDNNDESIAYLNSLTPEQQQHPIVRGIKGKALYYKEQYELALNELLISYKSLPDSKTIRFIFDSYIKLNNSNDALSNMASHLDSYPDDLENRMYLANELAKKNKNDAITQYLYVINKDEKNIVALNNLAWLLMDAGSLDEAKKYIDLAIKYSPKSPAVIDTYEQVNDALKKQLESTR